MDKLDLIFDCETSDPDDIMTLMLLCDHPRVNLKAVTVTPGSAHQIGVVRHVLKGYGLDIPVGAFNIGHAKTCVSDWHYGFFGEIQPDSSARPGWEVLAENVGPNITLLTGGPLKNLGGLIKNAENWTIGRWVAQGGFAGEGVVPPELQLEKFKGKRTCPTFNFNGDPSSALSALSDQRILKRVLVSKNVCHGLVYDGTMHAEFQPVRDKRYSLNFLWQAMDNYLFKHPKGKMFHDPLAAACAIDESIGLWREVEVFREKGEWGSRLKDGTNTNIIIDFSREKFLKTIFGD